MLAKNKTQQKKKKKTIFVNAMLDNLKCLEEAKGFQNRKTDDEAVGAGPLINFLFAGFKFKAPPTLSSANKNK